MGQQIRTRLKRKRRKQYEKRLKEAARVRKATKGAVTRKSAVAAAAAAAEAKKPAKKPAAPKKAPAKKKVEKPVVEAPVAPVQEVAVETPQAAEVSPVVE